MKKLIVMTLAAAAALGAAGCSGKSEAPVDNAAANAAGDTAVTDDNLTAVDSALGADNLAAEGDNAVLDAGGLNAVDADLANATENSAG